MVDKSLAVDTMTYHEVCLAYQDAVLFKHATGEFDDNDMVVLYKKRITRDRPPLPDKRVR